MKFTVVYPINDYYFSKDEAMKVKQMTSYWDMIIIPVHTIINKREIKHCKSKPTWSDGPASQKKKTEINPSSNIASGR